MRILFLSIEFSYGTFSGNGIYAISQVRSLCELGHSVLVICGSPDSDQIEEQTDLQHHQYSTLAIPLPVWGRLDLKSAWKEYAEGCGSDRIIQTVDQYRPDVALGVDWHSWPAFLNISRNLNTILPYSCNNYRVFLRSTIDEQDRAIIAQIEGQALCSSVCPTVLSRSDAEFVQTTYYCHSNNGDTSNEHTSSNKNNNYRYSSTSTQFPEVRVLLPALRADIASIPHKNASSSSSSSSSLHQRRFLLCCVRPSPEKEPHRFVDVVLELSKRGAFTQRHDKTQSTLLIQPLVVGSGWNQDSPGVITEYARNLRRQLEENCPSCRFVDSFLGPTEMAEIYSQTILNFHPPAYDAYGMTVIEAASQGAPSLVAHMGHVGATDLLDPHQNEIFTTNMEVDVQKLADVVENLLEELMRDGGVRHMQVGEAAQRKARQWSEKANAQALISIIEQSLDLNSSSHYSSCRIMMQGEVCRSGVDVVDGQGLQLDVDIRAFESKYLSQHRPVILRNIVTEWPAMHLWTTNNSDRRGKSINIDALERAFGNATVTVTDTASHHKGQGPCKEMALKEYCQWFRRRNDASLTVKDNEELWYLKDFHFVLEEKRNKGTRNNGGSDHGDVYHVPALFSDDWLNEWCIHVSSIRTSLEQSKEQSHNDYRFVYLGPKGSSTPLHSDVLRSHSWSANISGRKLWRLMSPDHARTRVLDATGFGHSHDFSRDDILECFVHEFIQYPNEIVFVPSGWFHTVFNIDDCLSINHNWISTHCIRSQCWEYLKREYQRAAEIIEDCREMNTLVEFEALVQRNVGCNAGMEYTKFAAMVRYIAEKSLAITRKKSIEVDGDGRMIPRRDNDDNDDEGFRHYQQAFRRIHTAIPLLEELKRHFESIVNVDSRAAPLMTALEEHGGEEYRKKLLAEIQKCTSVLRALCDGHAVVGIEELYRHL